MGLLLRLGCFGALLAAGAAGCRRAEPDEGRAVPAPSISVPADRCSRGPGFAGDLGAAAPLPIEAGEYCLDPNGETRAYGEGEGATLQDACARHLDGECDLYRDHGLARLVLLRYVEAQGGAGAVAVRLSRFRAREEAFGFFTRRVLHEGDPAESRVEALDSGVGGAFEGLRALVVRGEQVVELSYASEAETPAQMNASAARVLPALARAFVARLPGSPSPLPAVAALPVEERVPLGVSYVLEDSLGIAGLGPGAVGFYRRGAQRYRILSLRASDEAAAGDVIKTLRRVERAARLKDLGTAAVVFERTSGEGAPRTEWVVLQAGAFVFGVGDEELVLGGSREGGSVPGPSASELEKRKLSRTEKVKLLRRLVVRERTGP